MDFVESRGRFADDDEEIRQDEELIEAVEELIETAAVSVWSGIVQDVQDGWNQVQTWLEYWFPILLAYEQDPSRIGEDLSRLALYVALAVLSFVVLAPASSWRRRKANSTTTNNAAAADDSGVLTQQQHSSRDLHAALRSPFSSTDPPFSRRFSGSHWIHQDDESDADDAGGGSRLFAEAAAETDEERFEQLWPITISFSKYNRLVLPPVCRRVKASEKQQQQPAPQQKQQPGSASKQPQQPLQHHPRETSDGSSSEDDNPVMRLQIYVRNFLWLIRSLLSFDYAGASNTILQWLQGIRRYRRTNSSPVIREDDVDAVDDENEQEPAAQVDDKQRGQMLDHDDDEVEQSDSAASEKEESEKEMRSGDTSPTRGSMSSSRSNQMKNLPEGESIDGDETATSQFDEASPQLTSPMHQPGRLTDEGEEKKDSGSSVEFANPPLLPSERSHSGSIYYDPTNDDMHDSRMDQREPEHAEHKKKRFYLRPRRVLRSTPKAQDLLTSYEKTTDIVVTEAPIEQKEDIVVTEAPIEQKEADSSSATGVHNEGTDIHVNIPAVPSETEISTTTSPGPASQRFFFEAADTQGSLKRMSIAVPVPDKNGYVLDDHFLPDDRYTPLLVFVNSRSGPQQGHLLITQLRRLLNPIQVWDLADGGPEQILESFCVLTRLRILVCGGDGTVSWIISALEQMKLERKWPPIALLPLGTGNDLARVHGWGGGFNNESLIGILQQIQESYISMLDRWEVTIEEKKQKEIKNFINYLGVGADAQAALQVHYLRESRPDWFFSRIINKAWYGIFGAEDIIKASCVNVREEIRLFADGVEIPLPRDSQGIILLNIDSYAGGVPLWSHGVKAERTNHPSSIVHASDAPRRSRSMSEGDENEEGTRPLMRRFNSMDSMEDMPQNTVLMSDAERFAYVTACDRPSSCQDGLLDVVSIRGAFHLGQIKVGLSNAQRLCQCREVSILIKEKAAVQIDGEPWRQRPCTIRIRRKKEAAAMLHRSADDGGVEMEMSKLLDWAEERQLIDRQVHSILMKEFSRRIESKIRQRRARTKENIMRTLKKAISSGAVSNLPGAAQSSLSWGQDGIAF